MRFASVLGISLILLAAAQAEPPASQPAVPGLVRVRYFAKNGQELRITDAASCQAALAWLHTVENGPVSEHAKLGACDRDAEMEIYTSAKDEKPARTVELFVSCNHVSGRTVTAQQFADLRKLLAGNSAPAATPPTLPSGPDLVMHMPPPAPPPNVRVRISNQSYKITPVDITFRIDGKEAITQKFEVGHQHNYETFWISLAEREFVFSVESKAGGASHKETATITKTHRFIDIDFVTDPDPRFSFQVVDEDRKTD